MVHVRSCLLFSKHKSPRPTTQQYETLYVSAGYHSGTRDAHGGPLVKLIKRSFREEVQSVLDVGCLHGGRRLLARRIGELAVAGRRDRLRHGSLAHRRAPRLRAALKPEGKCTAQLIGLQLAS